MYIGHFSLALAVNGRRSHIPLVLCLVASIAPDLVATIVDLLRSDIYSHSLLSVAGLSVGVGLLARTCLPASRDSFWVAALVASHLPADWLTSRLALWPDGPVWGAGLYARPGIDFILEGAMAVAGWLIYRRGLPEAAGRRPLAWALLGALLALQGGWNIVSSR